MYNTNVYKYWRCGMVRTQIYLTERQRDELAALENFVSLFRVVPVSAEIAKAGGFYKRDYCKPHCVGLAHAILAATAEAENAELKTLNTKHTLC